MTSISKGSFTRRTTATTITTDTFSVSLEKIEEILLNKPNLDQSSYGKLQSVDVVELFKLLQVLKKEHGFIVLENYVLEVFLEKNDLQLLHAVYEAMDRHNKVFHIEKTKGKEGGSHRASLFHTPRSQSASSFTDRTPTRNRSVETQQIGSVKLTADWRLNYTIKNELTEKLIIELNKAYDDKRKKGIKTLRAILSRIEELKYRETDIVGTIEGFLQNVIDISYDPSTGTIPTEKYLKYFINWIKNALAMIGSMRLKIQSLKENCGVQKTIIIKKSNLGGCITSVDFEVLKLRRSDYLQLLEDRTENLLKIKQASAKASNTLSANKNTLLEIEARLKHIVDRIVDGKNQIKKMQAETKIVQDEIDAILKDTKELKTKIEYFSAPSIEDHINMKDKLIALEREKNATLRRNQILKLKLKNVKRSLKQLHAKYK